MDSFQAKLRVLQLPQQRLWAELSEVPRSFTLYGGTAVALHLGHRQSFDFDFFGWHAFSPIDLAGSLRFLDGSQILESSPNTLTVLVDRDGPVKISFFAVPRLNRILPALVSPDNGLHIASLLDLAGTKLKVIQQRAEAKDYIDVDAILNHSDIDLPMALASGRYLYRDTFSPQNALKALTFFDEPQLKILPIELRKRLLDQVKRVDLDQLPQVAP